VELLLEEGVDKDTKNRWRQPPLEEAIRSRRVILHGQISPVVWDKIKLYINEQQTVHSNNYHGISCSRQGPVIELLTLWKAGTNTENQADALHDAASRSYSLKRQLNSIM
jgi:hypothetical protein